VTAVATSTTADQVSGGSRLSFGVTGGFQAAFVGGAGVALVALVSIPRRDLAQPTAETQPALETA
jgi:hypothetical protein